MIYIKREEGSNIWVSFKYEQLPDFCFDVAILVTQLQLVIALTRRMMARIRTLVHGSGRKQLNSHDPITTHQKMTKRMLT